MSEEVNSQEVVESEIQETNTVEDTENVDSEATEAEVQQQEQGQDSEISEEEARGALEEALPELTPAQIEKLLETTKHKVKINGEEKEIDYATLRRDYQIKAAADKKFKDAAEARKKAEDIMELLRKDPKKALSHPDIGIDLTEFAENIIVEHLEQASMTPEQKELSELRRFKEQQEKAAAEKAAQEAESQEDAEVQALVEQFESEAPDALVSAGLPITEWTYNKLKQLKIQSMREGYEVTTKELASLAKEDYDKELKTFFSQATPDVLAGLLGEKVKDINDLSLKQAKSIEKKPQVSEDIETRMNKPKEDKFESLDDYFSNLRKKYKN